MRGKITVVTPSYQTSRNWLQQCVDSVQRQTIGPVEHIIIDDSDPSFTPPFDFEGTALQLDQHYGDYGDTPRWFGVQDAIKKGADIIAFLDADNWYEDNHLERCIDVGKSQEAVVVASQRMLVTLTGDPIDKCQMCGTVAFADTSSMVFFAPSFEALRTWGNMAGWQHPIGDSVVWHRVKQMGFRYALSNEVTLNYRGTHRLFYENSGLPIPMGVKTAMDVEAALDCWERG
jgi:glycosyltransferase involved in cell wall biosynthesis